VIDVWIDSVRMHQRAVEGAITVLQSQRDPAVTLLANAIHRGNKVLLCGNGGSAADAMHLAAEFVGRYQLDRRAYPALAFSADPAVLTAVGNDYGFETVFARQVKAHGMPGDVLIALSTSGKSKNVLEAIIAAKYLGLGTIGISGATPLHCDIDIAIPSTTTARIQEVTILVGHLLVEGVEERLPA
jgi:D-sedoheptulose 7-phosphate isomerase